LLKVLLVGIVAGVASRHVAFGGHDWVRGVEIVAPVVPIPVQADNRRAHLRGLKIVTVTPVRLFTLLRRHLYRSKSKDVAL